MVKKLIGVKRVVISFAVLLVVWHLAATYSGVNPTLFPTPFKVLQAFGELATTGLRGSTSGANLFGHIAASMGRFLTGYLSAVVVAVVLGLILGWFPKAFAYVNPIVQLLRPIAPVAWLPFIVLLVGIGDLPAIAIIFIAGFFPILLSTVTAVRNMDPIYLKVARNFDLTQRETLTKIVFPATFPQIIASLHQALSTCWIFLVSGEMVGSQSGLGFLVMDAKNCIRADALLATMITIGVIGLILDQLIGLAEKLVAKKWGFGIVKYGREEGE
jgi:NitT/TauT family transport system permease protein